MAFVVSGKAFLVGGVDRSGKLGVCGRMRGERRAYGVLFASAGGFDYDVAVIGAGVGGHGAALHAVSKGLKTCIFEAADVGGTCVNRGCVPSKALLAAAGRLREMKNTHHLQSLGISVEGVEYDRQSVSDHANGLASRVRKNMSNALKGLGVEVIETKASMLSSQSIKGADGKTYTAKNVILAPGSVPFVPPGITIDGKTVFTSDEALKLEHVPEWIAIIGSGKIPPPPPPPSSKLWRIQISFSHFLHCTQICYAFRR